MMHTNWLRVANQLTFIAERILIRHGSYYSSCVLPHINYLKEFRGNNIRILRYSNYPIYNQCIRWKYDKHSSKSSENEDDTDSDDDLGDFKDEPDGKVIKTSVKSLRLDLIAKAGLGLARNKVENIFYENKIRLNGEKVTKKSMQLQEGDEVDVVKGFSITNPEHLQIARVQLLATSEKEEGYRVAMRRFKSIVIENYPGQNAWKSSS